MSGLEAIGAISPGGAETAIARLGLPSIPQGMQATQTSGVSFGEIISAGMRNVETKVADANAMVRKFAIDDSVPLHQVTFAVEEARLSVELAMQVRGRLVESYRELMNMQL